MSLYDEPYYQEEEQLMQVKCVSCKSPNILCTECGDFWDACNCQVVASDLICMGCSQVFSVEELLMIEEEQSSIESLGDEVTNEVINKQVLKCTCIPENKYFCGKCKVTRSDPKSEWKEVITPSAPGKPVVTKGSTGFNSSYSYTGPDRHYGVDIDLGNGVIVHPSSMNNERNKDSKSQVIPDFGLYADYGWRPTWRNEMINWPDYGIPKSYETASDQIIDAYNRAVDGEYVEFGCIGGHGRTGTILGCMKILAERTSDNEAFTYKDAITWVRTKYCDHAIESEMQEWFIGWFDHHNYGTILPTKPEPKTKTYGGGQNIGNCSASEHFAMAEAGWKECAKFPGKCKWWEQDLKDFADPNKSKQVESHKQNAEKNGLVLKYKTELEQAESYQYSDCSVDAHYAMWVNGYSNCCEYGGKCDFFKDDIADFKKGVYSIDTSKIETWLAKYPKPKQPVSNHNSRKNRRNRRNRGRK